MTSTAHPFYLEVTPESSIYAPHGNPLEYPGTMIDTPVIVSGGKYQELRCSDDFRSFTTTAGADVDAVLSDNGTPPTGNRLAQVAFGANRNLANLVWKFKRYDALLGNVSQSFVAIPVHLENSDVVACNIGYWGYVYSALLTTNNPSSFRSYLKGITCPAVLLLLDKSQLEAMHHSEGVVMPGEEQPGVSCGVAFHQVRLSSSICCMAQIYSLSVPFLSFNHKDPVAFATVAASRRGGYPALTQVQMFETINSLIKAEPPRHGRVPIAETLKHRAHKLLAQGIDKTRQMSEDPLYRLVRQTLQDDYSLIDDDGKVRMGLEGITEILYGDRAWELQPVYRPYRG